jgi:hypothetical protein
MNGHHLFNPKAVVFMLDYSILGGHSNNTGQSKGGNVSQRLLLLVETQFLMLLDAKV